MKMTTAEFRDWYFNNVVQKASNIQKYTQKLTQAMKKWYFKTEQEQFNDDFLRFLKLTEDIND